MRQQHLHHFGVLLRYGPHQRRLAARAVRIRHSRPCASSCSTTSGEPERAATISGVSPDSSARFGFAPAVQQPPHHGRASVLAGRPQRRHAQIVGRVYFGARANQQVGAFEVVMIAGPMQRRGAIGFGGVDVRLFLDQRAQRSLVAVLGRLHQRSARSTADGRQILPAHREHGACRAGE